MIQFPAHLPVILLACEVVLIPGLGLFLGVLLPPAGILAVALSTVGMAALGCLFSAVAAAAARTLAVMVTSTSVTPGTCMTAARACSRASWPSRCWMSSSSPSRHNWWAATTSTTAPA